MNPVPLHQSRWTVLALTVWCSFSEAVAVSQFERDDDVPRIDLGIHAPVKFSCGVYALGGAMKTLGVEFSLDDLLQEQYISTQLGSTMDDLCRAADDFGVFAYPHKRLNLHALESASNPMILYLSRTQGLRSVPHWVLFLGMDTNGDAIVYDAPRAPFPYKLADLLTEWNGVAIEISKHPKRPYSSMIVHLLDKWWLLALVVGILALKPSIASRIRRRRSGIAMLCNLVLILSSIIFVAYAYHSTVPTGLLKNASATATIAKRHLSVSLPRISVDEVQRIVEDASIKNDGGQVILVDARLPEAFAWRTIPGAINVPVSSDHAALSQAVDLLKNKRKVIVFCQSKGCNWDELIAQHLVFAGLNDVAIFEGGVKEWYEHIEHQPTELPQK
ncbi:MAG TPA: rhodanese-like domain-containing protein [Pirellulaceae bacterium]|nr:rhodanese-like domain-containing protein [Pirellulaceae bacterium]HMO91077.1 rhodanese-like domain-containing protein [Pirellulaceae bacterium]HMP68191.1 rhodanese-like domain-containing protein [Pirellulaceae bacterium]